MGIEFSDQRWRRIKEDTDRWWAGELDRPLIRVVFSGCDPGRPEPDLPDYGFASFYDLSVPAEAVVDRWDYNLSCMKFAGDGFPFVWPNFGAGAAAAFMGAKLVNSIEANTTWFHPNENLEISDIHLRYDGDNVWLKRVKDICRAAGRRWGPMVQVGMTDLGGNLDLLSTFRPSEKLLLDLYDHPDEVKRLTWEEHELWFRYYDEISDVLRPINPGYSSWAGIFSSQPHYMLQCDFCYMIGPEMFDEFVRPELVAACKRLPNAIYHLDGPGQLDKLDSLLAIDELKGIQWVFGTGNPGVTEWPEVYRKIRDAGKLCQVCAGDLDELDVVVDQLGSAKGIYAIMGGGIEQEEEIMKRLEKYNVPR